LPKLAALFRTIDPPLGIFGIYGNIDKRIRKMPPDQFGGLKILDDEDVATGTYGASLRILGLSMIMSRHENKARVRIQEWIETVSDTDFTIVIGHRPDYIMGMNDLPVDLCLAGHTHGGQIRIPWYGPVITLTRVPHSWARGYRRIGNTRLNVSAGVGNEHAGKFASLRFNCPPEMSLIILEPSENAALQ
jgi:predicted MPP superfamily phosphohydrolase